ncbi:putative T7SS-secreted protein [Streptomyces buecherae]|uniref:putative T7SS-secreted protein n=1 Tax=Streptomyces buecherae TaxID=2763006 RepID=UPI0037BC97BA
MAEPERWNPARPAIPEGCTAKDLIPGEPDDVDSLVAELRAYAGAFRDGHDRLGPLHLADWQGKGAGAFRKAVDRLPKELTSARDRFTDAASALAAYAVKLRTVQKRCLPIIEAADTARADAKRHDRRVADYNAAIDRKDETLPERPPDTNPGITAMEECVRRLEALRAELQPVVDAVKKKIDTAAEKAPDKPSGFQSAKENLKEALWSAHHAINGIAELAVPFVTGDEKAIAMQLAQTTDGVAYAAKDPQGFLKAAANWDEWSDHPYRAMGSLAPSLVLAIATGGGSVLREAMKSGRDAATRLNRRKAELGRDGAARERADGEGTQRQCGPEKATCGEPIDVATGEMVMSAVDVSLPGALPLVLQRAFVSGHPCGGWFGRTWAATLDQRLELDGDGVVFVADDGMVLRYPVPTPGEDTYPEGGRRWPLHWDGKAGGTMRLTQPERDRTLYFAPLPGLEPTELPLASVCDHNGDTITFTYDAQGTPTEVTHSGGYRIAVDTSPGAASVGHEDGSGAGDNRHDRATRQTGAVPTEGEPGTGAGSGPPRITALRLLGVGATAAGTTLVSYRYDAAGDLTDVINSSGEALRFTYDTDHRITSWTDRNGTRFGYVYDRRGRVLRTIGSGDMMTGRLHYDTARRTTTYTDSLGNETTYVYDETYKVVAETDPLGHTRRTRWHPNRPHRPLAVTDALGHTTRYTYDEDDRLIKVERPDGSTATATYDAFGLPVEVREPDGALWRHTYDAHGNRLTTTDPTGAQTHYTYDEETGHLASVSDPLGHTTRLRTNAAGLPVEITDPLGHTTTLRRATHGRVTAITDPLGHTTRQGWTVEGKLSWRERPDGTRESWTWDAEGNLTEHTDTAGHTTRHTHTHFDLPATHTTTDGVRYAFAYDTELRLTSVTNPQGRTWTYAYDAAGRLTTETDFNGRRTSYAHDAAGRLTARTNEAGQTIRYVRDALGRTVAAHPDGERPGVTYAYDASGRLLRARNADTDLRRSYDAAGRLLTETVNERTTRYAYDAAGRRTSRTTPSGLVSQWTYDPAQRPATLTTAGHELRFAHDAAGREISRALGEDVTLTQHWDALDRLDSQRLTHRSGAVADVLLQHREYAYRADDQLTEIRDLTTGTRRFDLDRAGRATAVHAHGWTERYAYDSTGNITDATAPDHPSTGEREFTGTLIRHAGRTTYEHDAQGRLTRRTRRLLNGQRRTWTYMWDSEDHLTTAVTPDGTRWRYTYDPLGRRATKQRLGGDGEEVVEEIRFSWDGTRLAEQVAIGDATTGAVTTWDYAPATHRPLTQTDHTPAPPEPLSQVLTQTDTRFHAIVTDLVGTPQELVTPTGTLAWTPRTTLWGTPLPTPPHAQDLDCPLRFPGQYADPETGLHYNYFRHYDPETGRYASPDPLGLEAGWNPQGYVVNPLGWLDPLGLAPDCPRKMTRGEMVRETPGVGELNEAQFQNFKRYIKGSPAGTEMPTITQLSEGAVQFDYTVPGRVPGSYAVYSKVVDADGTTLETYKTTWDPNGNIVHVKPK